MIRYLLPLILITSAVAAPITNPFGVFDFNLRGKDAAEQIHSLDGIGFDGIAMQMQNPAKLKRFADFKKAKPDLKLFAGYIVIDYSKPNIPSEQHIAKVVKQLAAHDAKLWLIIRGPENQAAPPNLEQTVIGIIQRTADLAAAEKVVLSLYPHDRTAIESAEEALVFLKKAKRPNITITAHLCHELRAGNGQRLDAVIKAIKPHLDLATISGSNTDVIDSTGDWSDTIKPLGEGDYDASQFLQALVSNGYKGPVILHTFGLMKKPASHYKNSFTEWEKMKAKIAPNSIPPHQQEVMKKPLRITTTSEIDVPAAKVWKLIAGFDTLPNYHASITTSELSEGGVVRKIGLTEAAGGGHVVERLVYYNDETREFSYKIIDLINCPFPLHDYQAFVHVEELSPTRCRVHWGSNFTVKGVTDQEGDDVARIIYKGCHDGIRKVLSE